MNTYKTSEHRIEKPSKFIKRPDGYEVTNNDGTVKVVLRRTLVMDGGMESSFYHTVMWVDEGNGWIKVSNMQSYRTKEEFIKAISEAEDFTQAIEEYRSNN